MDTAGMMLHKEGLGEARIVLKYYEYSTSHILLQAGTPTFYLRRTILQVCEMRFELMSKVLMGLTAKKPWLLEAAAARPPLTTLVPRETKEEQEDQGMKHHPPPPKDKYMFVYFFILLSGITAMLPWDMLMTINSYWHYKLKDEEQQQPYNSTELTSNQKQFLSYLGIASSIPGTAMCVGHAFVGNYATVHNKVVYSLIGLITVFVGLGTLAILDSRDWVDAFMISNLVLAFVLNIFRCVFRVTTSSYLGKFPVEYIANQQTGICVGGVIPVLVNLLILSLDVDMQMAGFFSIVFSCAIAITCLTLFFLVEKTPFYVHHQNLELVESSQDDKACPKLTLALIKKIFSKSWLFYLAATLNGVTIAAVYPAFTALVQPAEPTNSRWHKVYFTQVTCYLTFNVFNYLGARLAPMLRWPEGPCRNNQLVVLALASLRTAFVPLLMTCNVAPGHRSTPILFKSDAAYAGLMAAFAFSEGYLTNVVLMFAPKTVDTAFEQDQAASVVAAVVSVAFAAGYLLSYPLVNVV